MSNVLKSKKGTSLIEVMVAILILVIVIMGSSLLFVYARSQIHLRKHYRVAVQLTAQKLEELKAGSYNDIVGSEMQESIPLEDLSYSRSLETEDIGSYKKVKVTTYWEQMGKEHNVSLVTFIAPK